MQFKQYQMSSTFRLKKRFENEQHYDFGKYYQHYVAVNKDCYPGHTAIPIGRPDGIKICLRPEEPKPRRPGSQLKKKDGEGLNRFAVDLYNEDAELPTQLKNPEKFNWRRTPNETDLILRDYLKPTIRYDGIGYKKLRLPEEADGTIFYEYALDAFENPPPTFESNHLHQRYPLWKTAREAHGFKVDDAKYMPPKKRPGEPPPNNSMIIARHS